MSFAPTSPFWVSDQATGVSTLYSGTGGIIPLVVTVPPTSPQPAGPTGQVFNSTTGFGGTHFIFDTLSGTIDGWSGTSPAAIEWAKAGAIYTGLALNSSGGSNYLYAADFKTGGGIDVYNSSFAPTTLTGNFTDPNAIAGYAPYNVQTIGGLLYVEYASIGAGGLPGTGGYIDVFNPDGTFVKRLTTGGPLDAPWGITLAPATGFGTYSGDLLVGNLNNGWINAFNPTTGAFLGTLDGPGGTPLVNSGLWSLNFGNGGNGSSTTSLYFTAGINGQTDGLLGQIELAPEPATWAFALTGLAFVAGLRLRRRRN